MKFRFATHDDCPQLAEFNHQLIKDEGHHNRMRPSELEARMRDWLAGKYRAVIFECGEEAVAYALFRERAEEIFLRQYFVVRRRRRQGVGRKAVEVLRRQIWPKNKRLTVDVLVSNKAGIEFWRSVGYTDYALTLVSDPAGFSTW